MITMTGTATPPTDPEIEGQFSALIEKLVDADGNLQRATELERLIAEAGDIIVKLNRLLTGADFAKELTELQVRMQRLRTDANRQAEVRSKFEDEISRRLAKMKEHGF
jgi:hypothetical protein